jgi:hypothetical protein
VENGFTFTVQVKHDTARLKVAAIPQDGVSYHLETEPAAE